MIKQLDIKRIIKRINCLEHCISNIVDEERLQDLLMTQPTEVKQIKRNRLVFENKEVEDVAPEKESKK